MIAQHSPSILSTSQPYQPSHWNLRPYVSRGCPFERNSFQKLNVQINPMGVVALHHTAVMQHKRRANHQLWEKLTPGWEGWPGAPGSPGFPGTPGSPSNPWGPANPCRFRWNISLHCLSTWTCEQLMSEKRERGIDLRLTRLPLKPLGPARPWLPGGPWPKKNK